MPFSAFPEHTNYTCGAQQGCKFFNIYGNYCQHEEHFSIIFMLTERKMTRIRGCGSFFAR